MIGHGYAELSRWSLLSTERTYFVASGRKVGSNLVVHVVDVRVFVDLWVVRHGDSRDGRHQYRLRLGIQDRDDVQQID